MSNIKLRAVDIPVGYFGGCEVVVWWRWWGGGDVVEVWWWDVVGGVVGCGAWVYKAKGNLSNNHTPAHTHRS